ncbi:putative ABC transporter ATP-binding protein [Clavibacter michiganensis subsp. michiganensis]|nr:putative ABC transporter ATP-binding protein [Clavibacter michiganensis subsp. michiganensis]
MAGLDTPSNGEAKLSPGYSVGILMQEPELDESKTVLENVQEGVGPLKAQVDRYNEIAAAMAEPDADFDTLLAEMGTLQEAIDAPTAGSSTRSSSRRWTRSAPAGRRLRREPLGGEKRRVALCKLLLQKPDLLLLDEPTNHLDAESVLWLEQHLSKYPGAVLAVTHDRYFLDHVAEWIAEVDRGRLYPYEGNYSTYLEKKQERLSVQGKKDAKLSKRLAEELDWVRSNAKGRQAKSKARLARYEEMVTEAERTRKLDFEEIQIPVGPRLGSQVIDAKKLHKQFGERVLIDDLSFTLPRNGIVGVIGPNGVGKTTLFKTIVGFEPLDSGELKVGDTVDISYVDQSRGGIDPEKSLFEVVSDGQDYIQVGKAGGARARLRLHLRLQGPRPAEEGRHPLGWRAQPPEPRAHAQAGRQPAAARRAHQRPGRRDARSLENALLEFPGCAVVITTIGGFDRIATHILSYEGTEDDPANWYWFEGNFEAYEQNKIERLGADAAKPHRSAYRKLTRD